MVVNGKRYRDEVLDIKREGANGLRASIAEVLDMTVTEGLAFFADSKEVAARLAPLADVGLEYVKLGQPVPDSNLVLESNRVVSQQMQ